MNAMNDNASFPTVSRRAFTRGAIAAGGRTDGLGLSACPFPGPTAGTGL